MNRIGEQLCLNACRRQVLGFYLKQNASASLGRAKDRDTPAGQQGLCSWRISIFVRRRTLNLWSAVVRIVELFILGGKAGHALIAFLATVLAIAIVASGILSGGRASAGTLLNAISADPIAGKTRN
ncbi:hypothetical protein [Novosphingobium sp. AAP1]|uniref:hypothetical protein n=1 Tax=Novosphingobium sp. AAP1 TaxID=1523413 RepID=UPI0012E233E3|nr:hypothetical protein [Novosphingobium sp. AAP1]